MDNMINNKDILSLARKNILKMEPYSTARDECKGSGIGVWLDANESPYNNGMNRYPDPHQRLLKSRISQIKGVPTENIFAGNGSDEAIDLMFRIFCTPGKDNAIAISPSYGMYNVAAEMNDIEMREVRLKEDFSLDIEAILNAADDNTKLLFVCSPNNPTGNSFPRSEIERLIEDFNGIVVLDEAYIDYSSQRSMTEEAGKYPNLVILQTLSKAWGMAGLRIGLAIADSRIIELMSKVKYPYNINAPAQLTALDRIDVKVKEAHVAETLAERERVAARLMECKIVQNVYPSDANFILVKTNAPDRIYDLLLGKGIIVRNRTRTPGCKGCLRITIGTPEENTRLLEIMADADKTSPVEMPATTEKNAEESSAQMLPEGCERLGERHVRIRRKTKETDISVEIDLDNCGQEASVDTGLHFFDHMLMQIPHHGGISLNIKAKGDLEVDEHHTMEDVAITLGEAMDAALGSKMGIERYGFALPMDDCDAIVLMDLGGRIDFAWDVTFTREYVGDVPTEMFKHFFQSFANAAKCNLHIKAIGENNHHKAESIFKAFARTIRMAVRRSRFPYELPSSKGTL